MMLRSPEASAEATSHPRAGTILVFVSHPQRDLPALDFAIDLARRRRRDLLLVGVARKPHIGIHLAPIAIPVSYTGLKHELIEEARRHCLMLTRGVDADVPVRFQVCAGSIDHMVKPLLAEERVAAIVLGRVGSRFAERHRVRRWERRGFEVYAGRSRSAVAQDMVK